MFFKFSESTVEVNSVQGGPEILLLSIVISVNHPVHVILFRYI